MSLKLAGNNLIPHPLQDRDISASELWLKEWSMEPGTFNRIQAPSGTGKTTFANLLYGLRHDYDGTLFLDGTDTTGFEVEKWCALRQSNIAMVFQDLRLFLKYTAWENIQLKAQLTEYVPESTWRNWTERLGIETLLEQPCHTLSQGEKQRVAIVRALVQPFDWIILDEPFSNLDLANTDKAAALIDEVTKDQSAGLICLQLDPEHHFEYDKTFNL